jgi:endonuclease III
VYRASRRLSNCTCLALGLREIHGAMKKLEKAERIREQLAALYPQPPIPLAHADAFQLLVAVLLSAQTTDARVNLVTPALFARAPDAQTMSGLRDGEILTFIRSCGLAPTKARNIAALSRALIEQHGGSVPADLEALEALPGVGHKTASVVLSQAFGLPAFPVDTHIHRLAARWGLSSGRNVVQTEADLKRLFAPEHWHALHLQMIYFGREHCPALRHRPSECPICSWAASQRLLREPQLRAKVATHKKATARARRWVARAAIVQTPRRLLCGRAGRGTQERTP